VTQQGREPRLIEEHLLVSRFPETADFLSFASDGKSLPLYPEFNELFKMVGFGITAACLPLHDRSPGNAKEIGQAPLGQTHGRSEREHGLTEGIVSLTV
jgi:hypothetical protein